MLLPPSCGMMEKFYTEGYWIITKRYSPKVEYCRSPPKKSSLPTNISHLHAKLRECHWRIHHWWFSTCKTNPPLNTNVEPQKKIRSLFNRRFHHPLSASIPCIHFLCRILPNNIRPKSWESKAATPPPQCQPPHPTEALFKNQCAW